MHRVVVDVTAHSSDFTHLEVTVAMKGTDVAKIPVGKDGELGVRDRARLHAARSGSLRPVAVGEAMR